MRRLALIAAPALAIAALGSAWAEDDSTLYVRSEMQGPINEATNALWDIGSSAMDQTGGIDPALMDDAKWAALAEAADTLKASANRMAQAGTIRAALPGHESDVEPDVYSMVDVQSYIDADPKRYRDLSAAMAEHSARIGVAARARDGAAAGKLVGAVEQVCESCHAEYWYPQG